MKSSTTQNTGRSGLALFLLSFNLVVTLTSSAQVEGDHRLRILYAKDEFQNAVAQPYQFNEAEKQTFTDMIAKPHFQQASGSGFDWNNIDDLKNLKDRLDVIIPGKGIKPGNSDGYDDVDDSKPCDRAYTNTVTQFRALEVNYLVNDGQSISPDHWATGKSAFDVILYGSCLHTNTYAFHVNEFGRIGFGTNTPQAHFHFSDADLQVGDDTKLKFRLDKDANSMTFSNEGYELFKVNSDGKAFAREFEITIDANAFPDYVFAKDYKLSSLNEVEQYIQKNRHLPGIQSADEYEKQGTVDMGALQLKLLEKVEELTLYTIAQQKEIDALKKALAAKK